ncbi:S-adenosyl-L-methionine-dependent methyltransferase [Phellopilus nigrolimitatus]|nr:S-adenosyl-L-methionine-dependent methyltransferase [Phellopilus nigrolimitatus]
MHVRALEFYCGIGLNFPWFDADSSPVLIGSKGGLHRALKLSDVEATVVRAFDWDQMSCRVYNANYNLNSSSIVRKTDISTLNASDLVELDAHLWLLSPSCQPYTVLNPAAKGAADPRAKSFLHLVEHVIPDLVGLGRGPKWILVENVAGFEASTTRQTLVDVLKRCDYASIELALTPLQFGIPNSRLRYYLLAKARPMSFGVASREPQKIWTCIPGHGDPWVDAWDSCEASQLKHYLDSIMSSDGDIYKVPDRVLEKWGRLFDIVLPSSRRSCCFTRGYTQMVERAGSILQMNENLDTTRTFDEFLSLKELYNSEAAQPQAQISCVHSAPVGILHPLHLRYFTPSELLRLFHFDPPSSFLTGKDIANSHEAPHAQANPSKFIWPVEVSDKSKYRLLGNSVNIEVVKRLINYLFEAQE